MTTVRFLHKILQRCIKTVPGHETILPIATYAPWRSDVSFQKIFQSVKSHTMVDEYRCYELWQLVKQTSRQGGALIEIGVWRGGSGSIIAAARYDTNDPVFLCDTFTGIVKSGKFDLIHRSGEFSNTNEEIVNGLINRTGLLNVHVLPGVFPDETQDAVKHAWFRFCHIDVDVHESAKDTLEWIFPKMLLGGVVVFDDYGFHACNGITRLVDEQRGKADRLIIHNLNGHAILIKI